MSQQLGTAKTQLLQLLSLVDEPEPASETVAAETTAEAPTADEQH